MMRIACVETYFYFRNFLELVYFTKVKIQSILCFTFLSLSMILTLYWWDKNMKGKNLQAPTQKKSFSPRLKLFCPSYPAKCKQALEEKN